MTTKIISQIPSTEDTTADEAEHGTLDATADTAWAAKLQE